MLLSAQQESNALILTFKGSYYLWPFSQPLLKRQVSSCDISGTRTQLSAQVPTHRDNRGRLFPPKMTANGTANGSANGAVDGLQNGTRKTLHIVRYVTFVSGRI